MAGEFENEVYTDFSVEANKSAFKQALKAVSTEFGREYPLLIGGKELTTSDTMRDYSPSRKDEVVGVFQKADAELAESAIETATEHFESWKRVPPQERAEVLQRTASLMRERKHWFSALMVHEVSKSWAEADADTAEAIDFLDYYAQEMLRLGERRFLGTTGEDNNYMEYLPLGVVSVIPPWNFPLAIMAGMTAASVVTGNSVVLKPSSDSPAIAYHFVRLLEEAGLPAGVVNFITGSGSIAGEAIVRHRWTRMISFTGSREVGLGINEAASRTAPGQRWIKRVIAEMGGKDGIIVDASADIDAAVEGVAASAFGFQGQKCSACSRAIVHQDVYSEFVEKLAARTRTIRVGDPTNRDNFMGAVINRAAYDKIHKYIEIGSHEGRVVCGHGEVPAGGYYIPPTVIADVDSRARISQEEIFGPVLGVTRAKDFDDALRIANDTEFGLTGGIFCRDEALLERGAREFFVGNLYLNRKCTGALVKNQPFGGFNMSGTDSKAGGPDYLLLFSQAKVTTVRPI